MKKNIFIILALCCVTQIYAQNPSDDYSRNSLSGILALHRDGEDSKIQALVKNMDFGSKFDHNIIPTQTLYLTFPRLTPATTPVYPALGKQIESLLNQQNVGREILSAWYLRQDDGLMSMDLIHRRGRYDAKDEDIFRAQSNKRGNVLLMEAGNKLIRNSYVTVVDFGNIQYLWDKTSEDYYWEGKVITYLYHLDFSDELQYTLYDSCWIDEQDDDEMRNTKIARFNRLKVPLTYVSYQNNKIYVSTGIKDLRDKIAAGKKVKTTEEELKTQAYDKMIKQGMNYAVRYLSDDAEALRVKTAVYNTKPIRAKIGSKEGLKPAMRYYIYEYELTADNQPLRKRKAVVRAENDIADNREEAIGNTQTTNFYQIAGLPVTAGMSMEQHNDLGLSLTLGYKNGAINGFHANLDILCKGFGKEWYLFADGVLAFKHTQGLIPDNYTFRMSTLIIGLEKSYHFFRNFEFRLHAGAGTDIIEEQQPVGNTQNNDEEKDNRSWLFQAGAQLVINIYYPVQLTGGVEYNGQFITGQTYKTYLDMLDVNRNGLSFHTGIRVCF